MRVLILADQHPERGHGACAAHAYAAFQHLRATEGVNSVYVAASSRIDPGGGRTFGAFLGRADELLARCPPVDPVSLMTAEPSRLQDLIDDLCDTVRPDVVHLYDLRGVGLSAIAALKARRIPVIVTLSGLHTVCHNDGRMLTVRGERACETPAPAACHQCFGAVSAAAFHVRQKLIQKHLAAADAIVVPTEAIADRIRTFAGLKERAVLTMGGLLSPDLLADRENNGSVIPLVRIHIAFVQSVLSTRVLDHLVRVISALDPETQARLRIDHFVLDEDTVGEPLHKVQALFESARPVLLDQGELPRTGGTGLLPTTSG